MEWISVIFCFRSCSRERIDHITIHCTADIARSCSCFMQGAITMGISIFGSKWKQGFDEAYEITIPRRGDLCLYNPDEADGEDKEEREQINNGLRIIENFE